MKNAYVFDENRKVINVIVLEDDADPSLFNAEFYPRFLAVGFTVDEFGTVFDSEGNVAYDDSVAITVRESRDEALASTDWVVTKYLEKGEAVPQEWLDYRQALRDLPNQDGFPNYLSWPELP